MSVAARVRAAIAGRRVHYVDDRPLRIEVSKADYRELYRLLDYNSIEFGPMRRDGRDRPFFEGLPVQVGTALRVTLDTPETPSATDIWEALLDDVREARRTFTALHDIDPDTFYLTPVEAEARVRYGWETAPVRDGPYLPWAEWKPDLWLFGMLGVVVDLIPGRVAFLRGHHSDPPAKMVR